MEIDHIDRLKELVFSIREDGDNIYHIFAEDKGICYYIKEGKGWISRREIGYMKTTTLSESTTIWTPKPEPVKVPLTYEDMEQRVLDGKPMWIKLIKPPSSADAIYCFDEKGVWTPTTRFTYLQLVEIFEFINGDPCYKFEGGE